MSSIEKRVFITGASGLLGRAVYAVFTKARWDVYGCAFSRVGPGLHKVDLTNRTALEAQLSQFKPDIVIHCAAQRFPDKVDADPKAAETLNVTSTGYLAYIADFIGIPVVYISTDYVFDGHSPPYKVTDEPNPLNVYGKTKLQGEEIILTYPTNLVLRIPVIYGPVEHLSESAVTVLLEVLLNKSKPAKVSNIEPRCPSTVDDIANICLQLATKRLKDPKVSGIFHWCGKETFTKYEMVLAMAQVFDLSHDHIEPENPKADVTGPGPVATLAAGPETVAAPGTTRPFDTRLDTSRLDDLKIGEHTPFKQGIEAALRLWVLHK